MKHAVEIMLPVNDKAPLINNVNEIPEAAAEQKFCGSQILPEYPKIFRNKRTSLKQETSEETELSEK